MADAVGLWAGESQRLVADDALVRSVACFEPFGGAALVRALGAHVWAWVGVEVGMGGLHAVRVLGLGKSLAAVAAVFGFTLGGVFFH